MTFRQDINGLRAIAVIAVVLYHFGIPGFDGGFSGVDIFFVISGYLMTSIIFSKVDANSFNVIDFYLARATRIIPALAVLCIILMCSGWFFLPPDELQNLGKHIVGAATFLSNIVFMKESGYFDASAHEKWLLHTWSLSVEWQFYVLYPLLIISFRKFISFNTTRWTLTLIAAGSYLLSVFFPAHLPDAGFYLLPTRAWEMIAGGLIYIFSLQATQRLKLPMELLGIAIIAGSIALLHSGYTWPGSLAAIPVLGAVLIIVAANERSFITSNRIAQYIGTISYSLYLWHWPVVVLLGMLGLKENGWAISFGIGLSFLLAMLSYYLVERPWRNAFPKKLPPILPVLGYTSFSALIMIIGLGIFHLKGFPARVDNGVVIAENEQKNRNPRPECYVSPSKNPVSPMCVYGAENKKVAAIVIGDSHADATINAVAAATPKELGGILFLGASGCPALLNLSTPFFHNCGDYNRKTLDFLKTNLHGTPIIIINYITQNSLTPPSNTTSKPTYLNGVPNTSSEFAENFKAEYQEKLCSLAENHPVYVVQSIPGMPVNVPKTIARTMMFTSEKIDVSMDVNEFYKQEKSVRSFILSAVKTCKAHMLDPVDYLCNESICMGSINQRPLYYDDDHLSEYGNRLLVPMFRNIWASAIQTTLSQHSR